MINKTNYKFVTELEDSKLPKGSYRFTITLLEVSEFSIDLQHSFLEERTIQEESSLLETIKTISKEHPSISEGTFIIYDCFITNNELSSELINRLIKNGKLPKSLLNKSNYIN